MQVYLTSLQDRDSTSETSAVIRVLLNGHKQEHSVRVCITCERYSCECALSVWESEYVCLRLTY